MTAFRADINKRKMIPKMKSAWDCVICECCQEIILSRNVKEISDAIAVHAEKHVKNESDNARAKAEESRIQDILISRVFKTICSTSEP
jgi:hypothetical protein